MRVEAFAIGRRWAEIQEAARRAEGAGFDRLAVPEVTGDPFLSLGAATLATSRIGLTTAIAIAFPRSPMITAQTAWSLQLESGGRFTLGLGTQVKAHNERRFSVPWDKPAARMREYVESMRAIWRTWEKGEPLRYEGEHYRFSLMTPEFSPEPMGLPRVPVYVAAVRPTMIETVASYADGIRLHGFCTRRYLDEVAMPRIEAGLARARRDRASFEVCGGGFVATGPNAAAVGNLREVIRYRVAFYGSTPTYRPVLELHGWGALADELHAMTRAGRWAEMASRVPDEVLDEFVVCAPYEELAPAVAQRFGGRTDSLELLLPFDLEPSLGPALAALRALPSRFTGQPAGW
ncbi:MAG: TIGR03617 family F420-dependent LLM class oxidoreductase [Polyangiaceae bacterium]|nr:TIGR03617 family F420-dependent LLM class oxidoreductase [Polyangiaceae bacterium]